MRSSRVCLAELSLAVCCLVCFIGFAGCAPSWEAPRKLRLVQNSQQELAEFKRIASAREWYQVEFFDSNGQSLGLDQRKDLNRVATILITWPNGISARHHLIDPANLRSLLAE